jgi:hypothetical protein
VQLHKFKKLKNIRKYEKEKILNSVVFKIVVKNRQLTESNYIISKNRKIFGNTKNDLKFSVLMQQSIKKYTADKVQNKKITSASYVPSPEPYTLYKNKNI